MKEEGFPYDDILYEHRPRSAAHPPMSTDKRAAQFAPFAALKGHEEAVAETARLTERRISPDEAVCEEIDRVLQRLVLDGAGKVVRVTAFEPDARKDGGRYITYTARLRRVDTDRRELVWEDGSCLPVDRVTALEEGAQTGQR